LTHIVNFASRIQDDLSTADDNIFVDSVRFSLSSTFPFINYEKVKHPETFANAFDNFF
jgi:hypothetical protein